LKNSGRGHPVTKPKAHPKPRGGAREGAGRKAGGFNALPHGAVEALQSLRHRVPETLPEGLKGVADEAFQRVVDVMRGDVLPESSHSILAAAKHVREELCGPIAKKLEHSGPNGTALSVSICLTRAEPPAAPQLPNHEDAGRPLQPEGDGNG
jgi:hypothetical protein